MSCQIWHDHLQTILWIRLNKKQNLCQRRPQAAQLNNSGEFTTIKHFFLRIRFFVQTGHLALPLLANLAIHSLPFILIKNNDFRIFSHFLTLSIYELSKCSQFWGFFCNSNIIQEQINGTGFQKKLPVQFCIYTHWGLTLYSRDFYMQTNERTDKINGIWFCVFYLWNLPFMPVIFFDEKHSSETKMCQKIFVTLLLTNFIFDMANLSCA